MEFTMKNSAGVSETYFIDPRTGTAHKVRVLKQQSKNEKKKLFLFRTIPDISQRRCKYI